MQKVLIVTYYWPPGSGAGVQRWLKFSKYLIRQGIQPIILTVDPSFAVYPAIDRSLKNEIPPGLEVFTTRCTNYFSLYRKDKSKIPSSGFATEREKGVLNKFIRFVRGNFFIPDPRRGWNSFAFKKACELIETKSIQNLITTSPPHSTQLIGLKLKRKYPSVNWIADLRDPWTDIYYYDLFYPTCLSRAVDLGYEKKVLLSADRIITVGSSLKNLFVSKYPDTEVKTSVITNGFDEEDFELREPVTPEVFTIAYVGTLSGAYPVTGLLDTLKTLRVKGINFRLRFTGYVSPEQKELILDRAGLSSAEFKMYSDHSTAIGDMLSASVLLLVIPDHPSSKSIVTGKLFEYLSAGKPVLCLGPADGDAAGILSETGHGNTFRYNDAEGIADYLSKLAKGKLETVKTVPAEYSRRNLTEKVTRLLR